MCLKGADIFPNVNVEEKLRIGLPVRGKRTTDNPKEVPEKIFELFPVLKRHAASSCGDLVRWTATQLAIWSRLGFVKPSVLIWNEPMKVIQPNIVKQIGRTLF